MQPGARSSPSGVSNDWIKVAITTEAASTGRPFAFLSSFKRWSVFVVAHAYRKPCTYRNFVRVDLVTESHNVGHDGRAALLPFEAVGFAVQVDQPT